MKNLLIIDGHSLAMRSHFALAQTNGGLVSPSGIPINVCTGFLTGLSRLINKFKPTHLAIAFDTSHPSFRTKISELYKANRLQKPEGFDTDLIYLYNILFILKITAFAVPEYEGDDIIATIVNQCKESVDKINIYSADKDILQLIDEENKVSAIVPPDNIMDWDGVVFKYSIKPTQMIDYKSLMGDNSDYIQGVRGIGEKQAAELLNKYENLEEIFADIENLEKIKKTQQVKLKNGIDSARLAQKLIKLNNEAPIQFNLDACAVTEISIEKTPQIINELNLTSAYKEFSSSIEKVRICN